MQTKRLFSVVSVFIIVAMLLTACGGAATPAPAQPAQPTQAPAPARLQPQPSSQRPAAQPTAAPAATPAQPASAKKSYKIGFLAGVQDPFYFTMQRGAQQAAADLGVELVTQIPQNWNVTDQTPMLDAMVARGDLDALFLAPVDKDAHDRAAAEGQRCRPADHHRRHLHRRRRLRQRPGEVPAVLHRLR